MCIDMSQYMIKWAYTLDHFTHGYTCGNPPVYVFFLYSCIDEKKYKSNNDRPRARVIVFITFPPRSNAYLLWCTVLGCSVSKELELFKIFRLKIHFKLMYALLKYLLKFKISRNTTLFVSARRWVPKYLRTLRARHFPSPQNVNSGGRETMHAWWNRLARKKSKISAVVIAI